MEHLRGTLVHYPWGTYDDIPEILGLEPDGRPIAEFWLGAHPLSPSALRESTLDAVLADSPELLGTASRARFGARLPFLLKILSARHALSIQAHPSREQAEEGFAEEERRRIPLTASERTYKDDWPKHEIIVALGDFHTLIGFREPQSTLALFRGLGIGPDAARLLAPLGARGGAVGLQELFLQLLAVGEGHRDVVDEVLARAVAHARDEGELGTFARTAVELDDTFPGDPGILAALLMNRVSLHPGEAVYVPAGTLHAHLRGTGIEVMASSDNVIRGGLTGKHIAVDELVRVVDFTPCTPSVLTGLQASPGVWEYPTHCDEFDVWRLEASPERAIDLPGDGLPRIALVTRGEARFDDGGIARTVGRGGALFVPATNPPVQLEGDAQVFLGAPGLT